MERYKKRRDLQTQKLFQVFLINLNNFYRLVWFKNYFLFNNNNHLLEHNSIVSSNLI